MRYPANFDNVRLDGVLSDWLAALSEFAVEAVAVLGPDRLGAKADRHALCVHPPSVADMVCALAETQEFGAPWRESDAPLVAWQHIARSGKLARGENEGLKGAGGRKRGVDPHQGSEDVGR